MISKIMLIDNETQLHEAVKDVVNKPGHTAESINKLALSVKDALSRIWGVNCSKAIAQRLVAKALGERPVQHPIFPFQDWVRVKHTRKYINVREGDNPEPMSKRQFDNTSGLYSHMPYSTQTEVMRTEPSTFAKIYPVIPEVSGVGRFPGYDEGLVEVDGELMFNIYTPKHLTEELPDKYTSEGLAAIGRFNRYLERICEREDDPERVASILRMFIAHNIRNVGEKVKSAVMFRGHCSAAQGYVGQLVRALIGGELANTAPSGFIVSLPYTDYQEGAGFCFISTIEAFSNPETGERRKFHRNMDTLAVAIKDDTVPIRRKFAGTYFARNMRNYMAGTDRHVPIREDEDAHWLVIDAPNMTKQDGEEYGKRLDDLKTQRGQLLKYFLDGKMCRIGGQDWDDFKAGRPLRTVGFDRMIEFTKRKRYGRQAKKVDDTP